MKAPDGQLAVRLLASGNKFSQSGCGLCSRHTSKGSAADLQLTILFACIAETPTWWRTVRSAWNQFNNREMNKHQLRALALRDPEQFRRHIRGARERELTARHLLLNPERIASASPAELEALKEYIHDRGWRSLYGHDRRMYRLLRAGAEKLRNIAG
jgi:hypothetical protein